MSQLPSSRHPSTVDKQRCPRTERWFNSEEAVNLEDAVTCANISRLVYPVMIRGRDGVYELSHAFAMFLGQNELYGKKFELTDLEPVRYPGFKNYAETEVLLKSISADQWTPTSNASTSEPSLEDGMAMSLPQWRDNLEVHYRNYERNKISLIRYNHHRMIEEHRKAQVSTFGNSLAIQLLTAGALGLAIRVLKPPHTDKTKTSNQHSNKK